MQSSISISSYVDIDVDVDDVLDQINNDTLGAEVRRRNLSTQNAVRCFKPAEDYKPDEFRRLLCDILSLGYHVSNAEIIEKNQV